MALVFLIQFLAVFPGWDTRKKKKKESFSFFFQVFHYVIRLLCCLCERGYVDQRKRSNDFEMSRLQLASSRVVVTLILRKKISVLRETTRVRDENFWDL